jgi:hypothetical protein
MSDKISNCEGWLMAEEGKTMFWKGKTKKHNS